MEGTTEEVRRVIEEYYTQLFSTSTQNGKLSERECVKQVSEVENMQLISDVTYDEVKTATFSMHPDNSPGPDGLNPTFFQSF